MGVSRNSRAPKISSLSNQLQSLKAEVNPVPRAKNVTATPRPIRSNNAVWITKRARLVKITSATRGQVTFTTGDLQKALQKGSASTATVRVDGFSAWNTSPPGLTSNYIKVLVDASVTIEDAAQTDSTGPYEDYGGGQSVARVGVNLPNTLLADIAISNAGAATVFTVNTDPTARVTGLNIQTIVLDVYVRMLC
jgi:hypothetical protein